MGVSLPITTLLASAIALLMVVLSINVIKQRGISKVSLGESDDMALIRKSRAFGNLIEYAPIMIIMVGLAELQNGNWWLLFGVSALFFIGRLAHGAALGFLQHSPNLRGGGMGATFLALVISALYNLYLMI